MPPSPDDARSTDSREEPVEPGDGRRAPAVARTTAVAAVAGFLVGGVVVGLVVALLGSGGDAEPEAEPSRTAGPAVAVAEDCVRAASTVRRATDVIQQTTRALRQFDPDRLLVLLDRLEDLEQEARQQAASCVGAGTAPASIAPS